MVREKVGAALNSGNLMVDPNVERAVDRVAALGSATALGSELWHAKYGGHITPARIQTIATIVAVRLEPRRRARLPSPMLVKIARLALEEWLYDRCPTCDGRKYTGGERDVSHQRRVGCEVCHGAGRVQYERRGKKITGSCKACVGLGGRTVTELHDPAPVKPCSRCNATGRLAPTDAQRARALGIPTSAMAKWQAKLARARDIITAADVQTGKRVAAKLERA
jgi:hypothetical protein